MAAYSGQTCKHDVLAIGFLLAAFSTVIYILKLVSKRQMTIYTFFMLLGSLGYAFMMLVSYLFFSEFEASYNASYERYLSIYPAMWSASLIVITLSGLIRKGLYRPSIILFMGLAGVALFVSSGTVDVIEQGLTYSDKLKDYRSDVDIIMKYTGERDSVLYVGQDDNGYDSVIMRYLCMPRESSMVSLGIQTLQEESAEPYRKNLTLDEARDLFCQNDYVYLRSVDNQLIEKYGKLFNEQDLQNGQLYKVKNDGTLSIVAMTQ